MITFFVSLLLLCVLFGIGFSITGLLIGTVFWVAVRLPLSIMCFAVGLVCCVTIILIPLGILLFKLGIRLLLPGKLMFA